MKLSWGLFCIIDSMAILSPPNSEAVFLGLLVGHAIKMLYLYSYIIHEHP